jgi:uncharacterized membrane protein
MNFGAFQYAFLVVFASPLYWLITFVLLIALLLTVIMIGFAMVYQN